MKLNTIIKGMVPVLLALALWEGLGLRNVVSGIFNRG